MMYKAHKFDYWKLHYTYAQNLRFDGKHLVLLYNIKTLKLLCLLF